MVKEKEIRFLKGLLKSKIFKYPLRWDHPHPGKLFLGKGYTTSTILDNKKEVRKRLNHLEMLQKGFECCFFCDKYSKDKEGGRFLPMDKRESGDNGFGFTYACYKCIPEEYGRL
jgi:hypothetical protein